MALAGGNGFYGRERTIRMVREECLVRPRRPEHDPPVVALFGPRGSGKTAVLKQLQASCRSQAAQPFTPVLDLERFDGDESAWRVVGELAYQLSADSWVQFGRMRFPRFALGRMIVEGKVATDSPVRTQAGIEALLREALQLDAAARAVAGLIGQLPQLLGVPAWVGGIAGTLGAWAMHGRPIVRMMFRTGMGFYGHALRGDRAVGFPALVDLSRLGQDDNAVSRGTVNRVLWEAFLADLVENYEHGFRPRNTLVLLDNAHTVVGQALLTAYDRLSSASGAPVGVCSP